MKFFQNQNGFIHGFVVLLLLAGIGIGIYLVQQRTNIFPQAKQNKSLPSDYHHENDYAQGELATSLETNAKSAIVQINEQGLISKLSAAERPNIIFIVADDQPYNSLSIAGNNVIKTPNIDKLASPGIYLKNTYVPEGTCSPSRASIWTAKLPHVHGVDGVGMVLPTNQITLPEILKTNGYNTGFIGKCHLGDPNASEEYTRGFDFRLITKLTNGSVSNWYNYQITRNGQLETHTEYITDYLTTEALNYIKSKATDYKHSKTPFFLWLAHPAPHGPTTPPVSSNKYSLDQIPLPVSISDDLSTKPPIQQSTKFHQWYKDLGSLGIRSKLKDAYEVIGNLDDNVGRIDKTLEELGIKNDTMIVYVSDNGIFYGEHQLFQKGPFFYEEQVKSPLIISYPKLISQQKESSALVSTMDIMPTLLDIIAVPQPTNIQGKSFLKVLKGEADQHRQSVYFEYPTQRGCMTYPMRGVVTEGFKWISYLQGTYNSQECLSADYNGNKDFDGHDHELYDLKNDPFEMNNLMKRLGPDDNPYERMLNDPRYGNVIRKLRKERTIWATDTKDSTVYPIIDGKVTSTVPNTLTVTWKVNAGNPMVEIEYQEKNCQACPMMELTDSSHAPRAYQYTLSNLKPNTTYKVRVFIFGARGNGGYVDLEGKTVGDSTLPPSESCTSDSQCTSGQICQRVCLQTYPVTCKPGVCVEKSQISPSPSSGLTPGTVVGAPPKQ